MASGVVTEPRDHRGVEESWCTYHKKYHTVNEFSLGKRTRPSGEVYYRCQSQCKAARRAQAREPEARRVTNIKRRNERNRDPKKFDAASRKRRLNRRLGVEVPKIVAIVLDYYGLQDSSFKRGSRAVLVVEARTVLAYVLIRKKKFPENHPAILDALKCDRTTVPDIMRRAAKRPGWLRAALSHVDDVMYGEKFRLGKGRWRRVESLRTDGRTSYYFDGACRTRTNRKSGGRGHNVLERRPLLGNSVRPDKQHALG